MMKRYSRFYLLLALIFPFSLAHCSQPRPKPLASSKLQIEENQWKLSGTIDEKLPILGGKRVPYLLRQAQHCFRSQIESLADGQLALEITVDVEIENHILQQVSLLSSFKGYEELARCLKQSWQGMTLTRQSQTTRSQTTHRSQGTSTIYIWLSFAAHEVEISSPGKPFAPIWVQPSNQISDPKSEIRSPPQFKKKGG